MKIFLDTANINEIRQFAHIIDGVTTNPTFLGKEPGVTNIRDYIREICNAVAGPVSVEVTKEDRDGMLAEAESLAGIAENIVIKVPMTQDGIAVAGALHKKGIKTNITLIFSPLQALIAANAGGTYASIFVGRLDDIGNEGMEVVRDAVRIYQVHQKKTEIIVASIRHPIHVLEAAKAGAHIVTIPSGTLTQLFNHALTEAGLRRFMDDWKKSGRTL
jgi:transaldolase